MWLELTHFQLFYFNGKFVFCDFFLKKAEKDKQCRIIFTAFFVYIQQEHK